MAVKRRRWFWIFVLLLIITAIFWNHRRQSTQTIRSGQSPKNQGGGSAEIPGNLPNLPFAPKSEPSYIPITDHRIISHETNSLFMLKGQVTSEAGGALPGAVISLHPIKGEWPDYKWPAPFISQICDGEGRYWIRLNMPLHAYVLVQKEGFARKEADVNFVVGSWGRTTLYR